MRNVLPYKFSDICNALKPVSEFRFGSDIQKKKKRLKSCRNLISIYVREKDLELRQIHIKKKQEVDKLYILLTTGVLLWGKKKRSKNIYVFNRKRDSIVF